MSYSQGPGLPWDEAFALASEVAVHLVPCVPPHQRDALAEQLWADFNRRSVAHG